jgi:uncharacterized protein (TIGR03067 family)
MLVFGLVPALAVTVCGDEAKNSADLSKMQGSWVQSGTGPDARWVIKGEKLTATVNGEEYRCELTLDATAKPHPSADIAIKQGPGESPGKVSKAIYKFDGETLLICVARPGTENRPAEFKEAEDESYLFELKKEGK